jgi:tRNA pseudouridine38-40 synthase
LRYFLKISYRGTNYHGWQKQHNALGIQTVVENALQKVLGHDTDLSGSGRTDTGVHALQQYAHFDTDTALSPGECRHQLNAVLPKDIAVLEVLPVRDQAHARFDAVCRSYEYHIHQFKNPFLIDQSYFLRIPLNLERMNQAAALLADSQEKDYACFSKSGGSQQHTLCQIHIAQWYVHGSQQLIFNISANRFLRNMVRAIVGTLIEVGSGRISLQHFSNILDSQDRRQAGRSVPAQGLYLSEVAYPSEIFR